jgi:type III secretion protein HrpB1
MAYTDIVLLHERKERKMANVLAFRTPAGAVSFPDNANQNLGSVNVSGFEQIRVLADSRTDSTSNVVLLLTVTEGEELVAQLDTLVLTPGSQETRVYAVPGSQLTIFAQGNGSGSGSDAVDVLIYGN